jgi:hypothetical protein
MPSYRRVLNPQLPAGSNVMGDVGLSGRTTGGPGGIGGAGAIFIVCW